MAKLKADEIRKLLQEEHGYSKEQVKDITGINNLRQELNKAKYQIKDLDDVERAMEEVADNGECRDDAKEEGILDDPQIEPNFPTYGVEKKEEPHWPKITSYEWSDFVMGQFEDDELYNGNPTVDGLRRVTELLLGEIVESFSDVLQCPTLDNEKRATVRVQLSLQPHKSQGIVSYCAVADSYYGNTDKIYRNHPVAQAETRAEGRALKRALRLRKVNAAEEISVDIDDNLDDGIRTDVDMITDGQVTFIETLCRKLNINVKEFIDQEGPRHSIKETVRSEAAVAIKLLNTYQQNPDEIPPELVGFDTEWRGDYE